jgi:threonine aldolase
MATIDLRSDTVTLPTEPMRQAMLAAELGDDVLGDDPTVHRLEARCAELSGKDAALFVPSGTMANLIAIKVNTRPGDEVLMHLDAHPFHYESAGAAAIAGVQIKTLPGPRGVMDPESVASAVRPLAPHFPPTTLLCVEDTSNRGGGKVQPLDNTDRLCAVAREHGLGLHLDGARLWHAVVESGVPLARRARDFDTVSFCFSKGLGAPAGSILCGGRPQLELARRWRKMLGGAMRQSGLLAAAALYAIDHHVDRLAEDHAHARELAMGLMIDGFDVQTPETNIVQVTVPEAAAFAGRLEGLGVRCFPVAADRVRLVVHMGFQREHITPTIQAFRTARG